MDFQPPDWRGEPVACPIGMVKRDEEDCGQGVSGGYNPWLR